VKSYCSNCGTPSSPGASFCSGCGQKVAAPQVNCPTCGQIWPHASTASAQTSGNHSQPASNASAWPAPVPLDDPSALANFPPPTPSITTLQSFAPPQQITTSAPFKLPYYGKNFVKGKHCGNCGAEIVQGVLECPNCQTSDFAKIARARIKS
jgi:predicted amidophosphoribosyltransferase